MKASLKNIIISIVLLSMVLVVLTAVDAANNVNANVGEGTKLRVQVLDLSGNAVYKAKVTVVETGLSFYTDNKGMSPLMDVRTLVNCYDKNVTNWYCVTVKIEREGFVNTVVFNCVLYTGQQRMLSVKTYKDDDSKLPYVCYVESPPSDYVNGLFNGQTSGETPES